MSDCTSTLKKKKVHLIYQEGHALRDKFLGGARHLLISHVLPNFILNAQAGILPNRQALTWPAWVQSMAASRPGPTVGPTLPQARTDGGESGVAHSAPWKAHRRL